MSEAPSTNKRPIPPAIICGLLLASFAAISWFAVSTKSSTYDEPIHALGSWLIVHEDDYRVDAENPPLWQHWAALDQPADALHMNFQDPQWQAILHQDQEARFTFMQDTLYSTPGNDGEAFVRRSRAMMLIVGVALGIIIAYWAWKIGGTGAALLAECLYCFDPNFLAHSPLVKNDVSFALAFFWLSLATWLIGERITALRAANLSLALAATILTKFTGLIAPFILIGLLLIRSMMPSDWRTSKDAISSRGFRLLASGLVLICCALFTYLAIWACYHFRFDPTPEPGTPLEIHSVMANIPNVERSLGMKWRLVKWGENKHLFPQAFLHGVLYQWLHAQNRTAFLLGKYSETGWWYYFPLAILFKTPVTMLVAAVAAVLGGAAMLWRRRIDAKMIWLLLCLLGPAIVLFAASMYSGMNVGIRHILAVYPPMDVAIGVVGARLIHKQGAIARWAILAAAALLMIESLAAFPNFIDYFNFACGGARGGLSLLSDSNLDWGQDLPAMAQWQEQHPTEAIYFIYFGMADPAVYGIQTTPHLKDASVLAVSATFLQGDYLDEPNRRRMAWLRTHRAPLDVLNGTIYLYRFGPDDAREMIRQLAND